MIAPLGAPPPVNGTHAQLVAQLRLLRAALALTDPPPERFVLATEKTRPKTTFAEMRAAALSMASMDAGCQPAALTADETSGRTAVWGHPLSH
eukprot:902496-Pleurochrysis_carterae.AAC.1